MKLLQELRIEEPSRLKESGIGEWLSSGIIRSIIRYHQEYHQEYHQVSSGASTWGAWVLDLIDCTSISKTKKSFERKNVETFLNRKGSDVPLQTPQGNSREQGL